MRSVLINIGVSCFVGPRGIMQQPVAHEQRDAADACWNFDDDDDDRPAETLQLLPGAYPGTVRFRMSHWGWAEAARDQPSHSRRLHNSPEWGMKSSSRRQG